MSQNPGSQELHNYANTDTTQLMPEYHPQPANFQVVTTQPEQGSNRYETTLVPEQTLAHNPDVQLGLSILNLICCCCIFGFLAFIFSVVALATREQTIRTARKFNALSFGFNIASLVIGITIYVVWAIMFIVAIARVTSH